MIAGFWLLVAAADAIGSRFDWEQARTHWAVWMLWPPLFPAFYLLVRGVPLDVARRAKGLGVYAAAALVILLVHVTLHLILFMYLPPSQAKWVETMADGPVPGNVPSEVLIRVFWETLADRVHGYAFMLAATIGLEYHHRAGENARRAAELEAQLAQAQLQALKMQLQPHFLFNALNSVSALLHTDPAAADRMIARLGDFLRLTLHNAAQMEVPLEDEVRYVSCYLAIQEVRFRDRLTTQISVAPDVTRALVPNLILQPLVENAICHGIEPLAGAGRITIAAERVNGRVRLEVADNGRGPSAASRPTRGLGLANTAARLRALYGEQQRFEAGDVAGEGFRVIVEMPYQTAEPPACAS